MSHQELSHHTRETDWCRKAGLVGWSIEAQQALLTALVSGQNLIFVGRHGAGKTLLCSRISAMLGLSFRAIDCSKQDLTDLIGYVSPQGLQSGRVEYIRTELSIWNAGFLLLDEWSRARSQTQNSYAELLYGRTLQGIRLDTLCHVWAAMNPNASAYSGVQGDIDLALLSRFVFMIEPPDIQELSDEEFRDAVGTWADADAPLVSREQGECDTGEDLLSLIQQARERYPRRLDEEGDAWSEYLSHLVKAAVVHAPEAADRIDMRSVKCAHRAILARRSLEGSESSADYEPAASQQEIGNLLPFLFPALRLEQGKPAPFPWDSIHLMAVEAAFGLRRSHGGVRQRISVETTPFHMLPDFLYDNPDCLTDRNIARIITRRLTMAIHNPSSPGKAGAAIAALLRMLALLPSDAPSGNSLVRMLFHFEDMYLFEDPGQLGDLAAALSIPPDAIDDDPAMRIALVYIANREGGGGLFSQNWSHFWGYCRQIRENPEKAMAELEQLRFALEAEFRQAEGETESDPICFPTPSDSESDAEDYLPF